MRCLQALSSYKGAAGDLNIQAIATDVQKQLLSADVLIRKYGHEGLWDSFVRFGSKEDVEKKFDSIIQALQALTNRVSSSCRQPPDLGTIFASNSHASSSNSSCCCRELHAQGRCCRNALYKYGTGLKGRLDAWQPVGLRQWAVTYACTPGQCV